MKVHQFSFANQFIKFFNCFLCLNSKILVYDLWIKNGIIQNSEQLLYVEKCVPDMTIDCQGAILSPGFIDIQINGGYGYEFSDLSQELETSLKVVSKKLVKFSVTGFCITLVVSKKEVYHEISSKTYNLPNLKSGMLDQNLLKDFGHNPIEALHEIYELLNNNQTYSNQTYLVSRGISISLGDSAANFDQGVVAVDSGANILTHIFFSMNPFRQRDPHLVGFLTYDRKIPGSFHVYYGIITDLVHTHPKAIKIGHRANKNGLIIVTDVKPAFGLTDGFYHFGYRDIEVIDEYNRMSQDQWTSNRISISRETPCTHSLSHAQISINNKIGEPVVEKNGTIRSWDANCFPENKMEFTNNIKNQLDYMI